jgi:multiple sugar transport system permease protein
MPASTRTAIRRRGRRRERAVPYLMVLPLAVILLLLVYYPIAATLGYSLSRMDLLRPELTGFSGLENYAAVLGDPATRDSFFNSLVLLALVVLITTLLGLAVAFVLRQETWAAGPLIAVAIIPWALPPIVSGIVWRWIFHPSFGLANSVLLRLDLIGTPIQWLGSRYLLLGVIALSVAWKAAPLAALVFFSALQAIPREIYDAAEVDGAGRFDRMFRLTLPLLRPAFGIVLTTTSITGINVFDEVVSLAGYSDTNSTAMMDIYLRSFRDLDFGSGSALVYILMIVTALVGLAYVKRIYRDVEYM